MNKIIWNIINYIIVTQHINNNIYSIKLFKEDK